MTTRSWANRDLWVLAGTILSVLLVATGVADGKCGRAPHPCCEVGASYCSDAECCATTCSFDSYCCETAWDGEIR